ncbi:DIS3-like exonuclease 2 [Henckelia pumila]|uniref:DIS3-like exonuclease 2 n=1 Tax=Henckelia pumila TaxID=405737 RepID=UPI003C6E8451
MEGMGFRRRMVQSTLFPHKESSVKEAENCGLIQFEVGNGNKEEEVKEEAEKEERGRRDKPWKTKKKPNPETKMTPPGSSIKVKNISQESSSKQVDFDDSPITIRSSFFVKASEQGQNRKQRNQLVHVDSPDQKDELYPRSSSFATCSSASEILVDESTLPGGISSNQQASSRNQVLLADDNFVGSSIPTLHLNEETANGNIQNQPLISHDLNKSIISKSVPEGSVNEETDGLVLIPRRVNSHAQPKYFPPYLSAEAVSKAMEASELLKALFRVNAHNKLEAYCKVDGVPTDVLISGVVAQNRAFEGDIVAIVIDPPSLWQKMKGSNETLNENVCRASCLEQSEALMLCRGSSKGKNKLEQDFEHVCSSDYLGFSEDGTRYETGSSSTTMADSWYANGVLDNGYQPSMHDSTKPYYFDDDSLVNICEKLCYLVSLFPSRRPTGRVVAIVAGSSRRDRIVGFLSVKQWLYSRDMKRRDSKKSRHQFNLNQGYILLTPNDPKFTKMTVPVVNLPVSIKKRLEVGDLTVENDIVAAKVVDWAEDRYIPEACVIQNFGRGSDVEALIDAILFENAVIASEFSPKTLKCLPHLPLELPPKELQNRRDLRNLCIFTIDPDMASDLDDALSVESLSNGDFRVGVHIADVSNFVLPDTSLDIDAQIQSTSVYLLQHKIPMLPPVLSDNLASLKPGVDRYAFSIFWRINSMGEVLDHWIDRTIIRSCCKLSYEHAQEIIDDTFDVQDYSHHRNHWPELYGQFEWCDVNKSVKILNDLANTLKFNRFKGGALSLESPKIIFLFDGEGMPYDTVLSGRKDSNFLVEEFMLLANSTAAEVITRAYPSHALLRRHPEPNTRKLQDFESFCYKHGFTLNISSSVDLHRSLEHIRLELKNDRDLFNILISYAARPMQLAEYFCTGDPRYSVTQWGHYALAVPRYTHFTSPLRRYPDIVVHRMLAAIVEAESIYLEGKRTFEDPVRNEVLSRCFTGLCFNEHEIRSVKAQEALSISASKLKLPCAEALADVAAHCNERKLAARHVKDAMNKLYMWLFLKKKEILYSEARVLGLGPRFMSIYISKLAIERRIYYDETEGLTVEWLESTSTLILSHSLHKRSNRKTSPGKCKVLEEVALLINPTDLKLELDFLGHRGEEHEDSQENELIGRNVRHEPAVFPLTVNLLSKVPVALHGVGGDAGPINIVARLYISSYFHL